MKIYLVIFFLVAYFKCQEGLIDLPSYYIYSLDGQSMTNFKNANRWDTSIYTGSYNNHVVYKFNNSDGVSLDIPNMKVEANSTLDFNLGDESLGLVIKYMSIYKDGEKLLQNQIKIDYIISNEIIPKNYYVNDWIIYNDEERDILVDCKYTNPGPSYNKEYIQNVNLDQIVNTVNRNFGLIKGNSGIYIATHTIQTTEYKRLDDFLAGNSTNVYDKDFKTNNITFTKIFLSRDIINFYSRDFILSALSDDNKLYLFKIVDDNFFNITFLKLEVLDSSVYNFNQDDGITKIEIYYNKYKNYMNSFDKILISSSKNGLIILNKNESKWSVVRKVNNYNNKTLEIKDMLVISNTVYIIIEQGLLAYSFEENKFGTLFSHPRLVQLDYSYSFSGIFFIGALVDNDPENGIPEVFIDFGYNYKDPLILLIHKVYFSKNNVDIRDIAFDHSLGLTYYLDPKQNKLFLFSRAIPNDLISYNFVIDLNDFHQFKSSQPQLSLLSVNDNYYSSLIINDDDQIIVINQFRYPSNTLSCKILSDGDYKFQFNSYRDCTDTWLEKYQNEFVTCWNNSTMIFNVIDSKGGNIFLWIGLAIILIAVFILVISIVFCKNCCRSKDSNQGIKYSQQKGESIEIHVIDNKL